MDRDSDWKRALAGYPELQELHEKLREEIRARWSRRVPFADELFDRWERASHLGFGEGASVYDACLVIGDVAVGADTWVGPFTVLDGSGGGLTIGRNCSISTGVQIYTHDTVQWALTGGKGKFRHEPVTIGDCSYIGPGSIIAAGVTIGRHCLIGAQSLVKEDVPDFTIVAGIPARVKGRVELDGDRANLVYD